VVTNLSAGLTMKGKKVLLIDCDAQGNLQNQFNVKTEKTLVDLLLNGEVEVASVRPGLDLVNSGKHRLAETEITLAGKSFRETILKDRLKAVDGYDFIFCDLSPTVTMINTMALYFCDYLLVPVSMSFYAITGAHQILEAAEEINCHSKIDLFGLILNFYNNRTNLAKMVTQAVKDKWDNKVFNTVIRKNVAIEEAPSQRLTIFEHAPRSHGAEDFEKLTKEFLGKCL
jgi:chromosome partitioning protein